MPPIFNPPLRLLLALGLLLLVLVLLARVAGQGLLKNLEDLLIHNLLVRLHLGEVQSRGSTNLGEAVLGDGYNQSFVSTSLSAAVLE